MGLAAVARRPLAGVCAETPVLVSDEEALVLNADGEALSRHLVAGGEHHELWWRPQDGEAWAAATAGKAGRGCR